MKFIDCVSCRALKASDDVEEESLQTGRGGGGVPSVERLLPINGTAHCVCFSILTCYFFHVWREKTHTWHWTHTHGAFLGLFQCFYWSAIELILQKSLSHLSQMTLNAAMTHAPLLFFILSTIFKYQKRKLLLFASTWTYGPVCSTSLRTNLLAWDTKCHPVTQPGRQILRQLRVCFFSVGFLPVSVCLCRMLLHIPFYNPVHLLHKRARVSPSSPRRCVALCWDRWKPEAGRAAAGRGAGGLSGRSPSWEEKRDK